MNYNKLASSILAASPFGFCNQYTIFFSNVAVTNYDINRTQNSLATGYTAKRVGSSLTKWETSETTNFGFDASLFNYSWEMSFNVFNNDTKARLDWTVGRRGSPFLDWGVHPGNNWIRQVTNGGPYSPMKNVPRVSDYDAKLAGKYDWGYTLSALNVHIIRLADIYLLYAEACAETNDLGTAVEYGNKVRQRAANPDGFVKFDDGTAATNYVVAPNASFSSQGDALKAIRFERKIELGMEGNRFFDLVRWDDLTDAGKTALPFDIVNYINNEYLAVEIPKRPHLANVVFTEPYKYVPIPEYVITQSTVNGVRNIEQIPGF